ncbi:nuclear hormone receptor FTZ-F1 beta [Harmonia axyridis]|uniref:nuclear hormone receptor FTZ-F1 beta n=1 Tax=Harmonia axyridis TaxID=115357 RepID=UPI001E274E11|nr:nuclear hormone receptor FTZ-F1 beta [Harmonia axyridis]XP_045466531.1 nuclear hormone receptor FTZ-F1 beta [Harmonia axyridis]XP_045466532.1 nuclear hormone receptor FTZ-F1 beta [Harmonia axyridis]XP_045466533.1 nuclear hormone receptor FTZ-F1 beta [Harmonia axyridis]XP_045466534.1 nuclear hormone receptor FTZ-F1 beta [Harmonia axyridis]XP_045466535.1 nuclear hormone receptor FTZ-F1 beta [Harmonia axyridis]
MAAEMRSPNISVTPINMEVYHQHVPSSSSGEPPPDVADAEVARIEFHSASVNMRSKNKEDDGDRPPRPMSWEGELSDNERDMCVDEESIDQIPENLSIPQQTKQTSTIILDSKDSPILRMKQPPMGNYSLHSTPSHSPLLGQRHPITGVPMISHKDMMHKALNVPPTPSPDSAIHSAYSVFSSPNQSPLTQRHINLTPNLSRNNSDASHSSCCSYSSVSVSVSPTQQFSPTHSPIQGRHMHNIHGSPLHHNVLYRSLQEDSPSPYSNDNDGLDEVEEKTGLIHTSLPAQPGISRQQLINSPCPICGDKISGFHYGIFSCESCKGFFKRTVQNRKNYVCLRGASCPVTVATRKKCPACRFEKCLQCGMKLEAIREDRTRGGRSTYQCSYSLPPSLTNHSDFRNSSSDMRHTMNDHSLTVKLEPSEFSHSHHRRSAIPGSKGVPPLLQEIMDVEHLWHYNETELQKLNTEGHLGKESGSGAVHNLANHPLLAGTAIASSETSPDFVANLCHIADHRLYKIVKWCKSLPLFKNISIDDQICLLINSWCELLLFSCCFRSMSTPGEIRVSLGKSITLNQAREMGMQPCIERMLNFTEQLRRLRVDQYEYIAMKVILLLTSDTSELKEAEKVRISQEKALKALQDYTLIHYPESPSKFGELLLRIPELQRTCQVGKEMLTIKSKDGEGPSFNLLMELLRGDH